MSQATLREIERDVIGFSNLIKATEASLNAPGRQKKIWLESEGHTSSEVCEECKKVQAKHICLLECIHWAYDEILCLLLGSDLTSLCPNHSPSIPVAQHNFNKHNWIIEAIKKLVQELDETSKEKQKAQKKQGEAGRKNEELNKKIVKMEKSLHQTDSTHAAAQEANDKQVQKLQGQLRALELKLDAREEIFRKEQQNTLIVKGDWQKRLQKAFDKSSELEKQLHAEESAHKVTSLDLAAIQTDLEKACVTINNCKTEWTADSATFNKMNAQNEELKVQVLSLRSNDLAEKMRIDTAVRKMEAAKDEEIAHLRKMYQGTSRELAELRDSREKELAAAATERQNERGIQVALQRSAEEALKLEREKIGLLEEEIEVLVAQKAVAEQYAMWASSWVPWRE